MFLNKALCEARLSISWVEGSANGAASSLHRHPSVSLRAGGRELTGQLTCFEECFLQRGLPCAKTVLNFEHLILGGNSGCV